MVLPSLRPFPGAHTASTFPTSLAALISPLGREPVVEGMN